jgi:hypothetical protein
VPTLVAVSPFRAIRSAPTRHTSTFPSAISPAAAPSGITVCGIPACTSSQAVSRLPCSSGRVSSTQTWSGVPRRAATCTMPSAVPTPPVARNPVLQCVRTLTGPESRDPRASVPRCVSSGCPCSAIRRHASASSSQIACASASSAASTAGAAPEAARARRTIRSMAQPRFTAVGRAARMASASASTCRTNASRGAPVRSRAAATSPIAAVMPIAGAPRTRSAPIASTSASTVPTSSHRSSTGSAVWSSRRRRPAGVQPNACERMAANLCER